MAGKTAKNDSAGTPSAANKPMAKDGVYLPGESEADAASLIEQKMLGTPPESAANDTGTTQGTRKKATKAPAETTEAAEASADDVESTEELDDDADTEPTDETAEVDAEAEASADEAEGGDADSEDAESAEGDEPDAEAADTEAEGETSDEDEVPAWAKKRFSELTSARKAVEGELATAKAQVQQLQAQLQNGGSAAGGAHGGGKPSTIEAEVMAARTPQDLAALAERYQELEELALTHPEGYEEADPKGGEGRIYSQDQMRSLLVQARRGLRLLPQRGQFLQERARFDAIAIEKYPELKNPESELRKAFAVAVQRAPEIVDRLPDVALIIADAIRGQKARIAEEAAAAKTAKAGLVQRPGRPVAPKPGAAKTPPVIAGAPVRTGFVKTGKQEKLKKLHSRLEQTGSEEDVARLLEARFG